MPRIFKRSDKKSDMWFVDFIYRGKRIRKSAKVTDKKMAKVVLREYLNKIATGEFLGTDEQEKILFEDFAKEYLKYAGVNKAPKSYHDDCQRTNKDLLPFFSGKYLNEINTKLIEKFKEMKASTRKLVATNRNLALLKHMFTKAIEWDYLTINPAKNVKLFKEPKGRVRYLTQFEIERLLKELNGISKSMVITALNTGMRKGELINLKWQDVDLINDYIILETSKNGESRKIPINEMLKQELMNLPRNGVYVFSKDNGESYGNPRKGFESALKRAGIDNFTFHDLRHTFASHLAMSGMTLRTIAELLGHKTLQMTLRYSHLSQGYLKEAVNLIGVKFSKKDTLMAHSNIDKVSTSCKILKNKNGPVAQLVRAADS